MYYHPGDVPSAFSFNLALEGGRPRNDIKDDSTDQNISIELVPGVSKWNTRSVEFSMDSLTYSRIVASVGEIQARNCLLPNSGELADNQNVYQPKQNQTGSVIGGIVLKALGYPQITPTIQYETSDKLVFLCGDKDAGKEIYFLNYPGKWENGYVYDQYSKGKIVYVFSGPAGYAVTPTQVDKAFPCIVETPPFSGSWSYNNAPVIVKDPLLPGKTKQYRFDNRLEFLVTLAQTLVDKYLGISPSATREYDKVNQNFSTVVSDFKDGTSFLNNRASLELMLSVASHADSAVGRWLEIIKSNCDDPVGAIFSGIQAIKRWLCYAKTEDGIRNPTNLYPGGSIITDADITALGALVNNTPELRQMTALTMVVSPLVPGHKYTTYADPIVEKLLLDKDISDVLHTKKLLWSGNSLVPYQKEAGTFRKQSERVVSEYEKRLENLRGLLPDINTDIASKVGNESKLSADVSLTIPDEPEASFVPVENHGEIIPRKQVMILTPEFVSGELQESLIVSPLSGRKIVSYTNTPVAPMRNCAIRPVFVVDRSVSQRDWLRFLYCFSYHGVLTPTIAEDGKKRLYSLFNGTESVAPEYAQQLSLFIDTLNYVAANSKVIVGGFSGFSHETKGGYWRPIKEDESLYYYEYYPYWYDIVNATFPKPLDFISAGSQINVVYACDIELEDYIGVRPSFYHMVESSVGGSTQYVISEGGSVARGRESSVVAESFTYTQLVSLLSGSPESLDDNTIAKVDDRTGAVTKTKTIPAIYVEEANKKLSEGSQPAQTSGTQLTEFVYQPPASVATVEEKQSRYATVRLPISSLLLPDITVAPNMAAPLDSLGHGLYSDEPATYPVFDSDSDTESDNDDSEDTKERIAYSYLVAKSIGLIELEDSVPTYRSAYYSIEDKKRAFCKKITVETQSEDANVDEQLVTAIKEDGWENIELITQVTLARRSVTDPTSGQTSYSVDCLCFGTHEQEKSDTPEKIYLDLLSGDSADTKLYAQKVDVDFDEKSGYAKYATIANRTTDSSSNQHTDTSGWVRYRYYDEVESNQRYETFTLSPPSMLRSLITGVTDTAWVVGGEQISPVWFTPFWSSYGLAYGDAKVSSIDQDTKKATLIFYPFGAPTSGNGGENGDDDTNESNGGNGSSPQLKASKYDQYHAFPFICENLAPTRRIRVTTKTYKAQRSDWVPALCNTLDHNEVLIPGMVVEIEDTARVMIKEHEFVYYLVKPPESYSTALEGTPDQVIYEVSYKKPSPEDIESGYLAESDCWITNIRELKDTEELKTNLPTGTRYRFSIKTNSDGAPSIREPFGAFNDCGNKGSLTVFLRTTAWGVGFTCTCRLDFIPFGYAVPSKTPSCYYKTINDDCAVSLVSQKYLVKRIEPDHRLYLTGACYVPCSTLSSLG